MVGFEAGFVGFGAAFRATGGIRGWGASRAINASPVRSGGVFAAVLAIVLIRLEVECCGLFGFGRWQW